MARILQRNNIDRPTRWFTWCPLTEDEQAVFSALREGKELILAQREEQPEEFVCTESLRMVMGEGNTCNFVHWQMAMGSNNQVWTFRALNMIREALKVGPAEYV